jgi:DNA primase
VATLGANISSRQIELLEKYFSDIFLIADNDEAGAKMTSRLIDSLGHRVSIIKLDSIYKDIGDMEDSAIMLLDVNFESSIVEALS